MKKLYRKSTVYPSTPIISDYLSFLPAAILTLTVALSADEKEVLAYLISCSSNFSSSGNRKGGGTATTSRRKGGVEHAPQFDCDCFMCYRQYWARWDTSPNRQLIHEIIDGYEEALAKSNKSKGFEKLSRNCKKERRKRKSETAREELKNRSEMGLVLDSGKIKKEKSCENGGESYGEGEEEGEGSVRKFMSFVGEKIWSALG